MIVWRVAIKQNASPLNALSGEGAKVFGNRWNHRGTPVAYCSENLSLAVLEYLIGTNVDDLPETLMKIKIELPDSQEHYEILKTDEPMYSNDYSQQKQMCKDFGTEWAIEKRSLVLLAPSFIVPENNNIMINPQHPDARLINILDIAPFQVDPRIKIRYSKDASTKN